MTRLKVHHLVEDGGMHQHIVAERLGIDVSSVERILREPVPTPEEVASGVRSSGARRGRPSLAEPFRERVAALLAEEQSLAGVEVFRRARAWGYSGYARMRPSPCGGPHRSHPADRRRHRCPLSDSSRLPASQPGRSQSRR